MSLIHKSDKIVIGLILGGVGSLLSGAYIIDQLNVRNNKVHRLNETKTMISIVCWPITLPYALFKDEDKSMNFKL